MSKMQIQEERKREHDNLLAQLDEAVDALRGLREDILALVADEETQLCEVSPTYKQAVAVLAKYPEVK